MLLQLKWREPVVRLLFAKNGMETGTTGFILAAFTHAKGLRHISPWKREKPLSEEQRSAPCSTAIALK
jgi:hypothetical protein